MLEIKIRYIRPIQPIAPISNGDWIDLRAAEDVSISKGELKMIPLGVAMELPAGYEAIIAPRSSLAKNYGVLLANSIGIIDESYKGDNDEWQFPAYAIKDDVVIPKNTRIAQFRILEHQPEIRFRAVGRLSNPDRHGFGSTGRE